MPCHTAVVAGGMLPGRSGRSLGERAANSGISTGLPAGPDGRLVDGVGESAGTPPVGGGGEGRHCWVRDPPEARFSLVVRSSGREHERPFKRSDAMERFEAKRDNRVLRVFPPMAGTEDVRAGPFAASRRNQGLQRPDPVRARSRQRSGAARPWRAPDGNVPTGGQPPVRRLRQASSGRRRRSAAATTFSPACRGWT